MRLFIYFPFVMCPLFVVLSRATHRMRPARATWSLITTMLLLAVSTAGATALLAWPLVARIPIVAARGHWRPGAIERVEPVPIWVSVAAAAGLAVAGVRVARLAVAWRRNVAWARSLHARVGAADGDVVIVPDDTPYALALAGMPRRQGRVLVSSSMLATLTHDERDAVLAHERAHLRRRHHLFLAIADVASAINPILRLSRRDAQFALERWADDDAAAAHSRPVVAQALAKAALARLDRMATYPQTIGARLHVAAHGVTDRVAALLRDDDQSMRSYLVWLLALAATVAVVAVAWAARDTERLFESLQQR